MDDEFNKDLDGEEFEGGKLPKGMHVDDDEETTDPEADIAGEDADEEESDYMDNDEE